MLEDIFKPTPVPPAPDLPAWIKKSAEELMTAQDIAWASDPNPQYISDVSKCKGCGVDNNGLMTNHDNNCPLMGVPPIFGNAISVKAGGSVLAKLSNLPPAPLPAIPEIVVAILGWKVRIKQLFGEPIGPLKPSLEKAVLWMKAQSTESCVYFTNPSGDAVMQQDLNTPHPWVDGPNVQPVYSVIREHTGASFCNQSYMRLVFMETPPKDSPYPLIKGAEYHPELAGSGKKCFGCLVPKAVYSVINCNGNTHYYCDFCYKVTFATAIGKLPVDGMPKWYHLADQEAGWRWATLAEMIAFADNYPCLLGPGEYVDMADATEYWEPSTKNNYYHSDSSLMVLPSYKSSLTYLSASFASGSIWSHDSVTLAFALTCAICGVGGTTSYHLWATDPEGGAVDIGPMHETCSLWFKGSGAAEAHGLTAQACGHYFLNGGPSLSVKDSYNCVDCFQRVDYTEGSSGCARCLLLNGKVDAKGRCWNCYHIWANAEASSIERKLAFDVVGLRHDFSILTAIADFYLLGALRSLAPNDVDTLTMYDERVGDIADQLSRYTIMATGGELRHHHSMRGSYLNVGVRAYPLPRRSKKTTFYCTETNTIGCSCTKDVLSFNHRHWEVVEVRGAVNSKPWPNKSRPARDGTIPMALDPQLSWRKSFANFQIGGVSYRPYHPKGTLARYVETQQKHGAFGTITNRAGMWAQWYEMYQQVGLDILELGRNMFLTGVWSDGYGGYWWGVAADLVWRYKRGDISRDLFIDHVFGLQHNGGSLLNKVYFLDGVPELLDLKRECESAGDLLPWASLPVMQLYTRLAREVLDDPEMRNMATAAERMSRPFGKLSQRWFVQTLEEVVNESKTPEQGTEHSQEVK